MANELDKTIEELEAEVIAELEEGAHDAPKKGAVPSEPMKKKKGDGATGEEDIGGSTPTKVSPPTGKDASKNTKEIGGDAQQKGEGKPDKMQKPKPAGVNKPLAMGYTDDEIRELCHSKNHDCATFVEHPEFGKGKPIVNSHAIPDDEGNVEWYDVQFKHGLEEKVMAEDMKILKNANHNKDEDAHMPKTKADAINAMMDVMKKMPAGEAKKMYASYMAGKKEPTDEELELDGLNKAKEAIEKRLASINVKEDVDALVQGEDLSEEFQQKAATIFEAAVKSKIRPEVERIELEKTQEIAEDMETFKTELAEKVDGFLDYVVQEWMKENELAIERGLKGEIAEDFITGLKSLFEEHYIDVPDEKYDILESQAQKIDELESKLNETIGKLTEKKQSEDTLVRESVIKEVSSDLAETQTEKFASLVEDVEFTDKDSFTEKLNTLKENYFPKSVPTQTLTEENDEGTQEIDMSDAMAAYTSAIKRSAPYMNDVNAQPFKDVKN